MPTAKPMDGLDGQEWMLIDNTGEAHSLRGSQRTKLTHRLGLHARDLRFLDPQLSSSYPAAILDRPKAILVTLEFIKVIITVDEVVILNPGDPQISRLISTLKATLAGDTQPIDCGPAPAGFRPTKSYQGLADVVSKLQAGSSGAIELPFELKALEVCLETISSHLESLALELEAGAYDAVNVLTRQVTKARLQKVRKIKDKLVHLLPRLNMIRKLLMHFLDDDGDMHGLNLSAQQQAQGHLLLAKMSVERRRSSQYVMDAQSDSSNSSHGSEEDEAEIAAVEQLLEAYFMHIDNTYNRLVTLDLYIEDAEDLVNTKLDFHRNKLYTVNVLISSITTAMTMIVGVTAMLSMNLDNTTLVFPDAIQSKPGIFCAQRGLEPGWGIRCTP
ncbi:MAG: hypothetical protein WDW38_011339 [Sanguina aurantia]